MEIVFTNTKEFSMEDFKPTPAKKNIPSWYRTLEPYIGKVKRPDGDGITNQTAKRCMPLFDAISSGYIIYTWVDVFVSIQNNQHWYEWPMLEPIKFHNNQQAPDHPKSYGENFPKWMSPWSIKTPKGYSCLFLPPMHRDNLFNIFEGVVDTDTYGNPINFPFAMNDPKFEGLIPAGTPLAQVIPFKRDNWQIKFGGDLEVKQAHDDFLKVGRRFFNGYRDIFRQEKDYS